MAVKIHCSICDRFIKAVDKNDLQKLNGEETCEKCGKKVKKAYGELDIMVKGFKEDLTLLNNRMVKVYKTLDNIYNKYLGDIQSFYTTRTAEFDKRMENILNKEN